MSRPMEFFVLYLSTALIFLVIDAVGLTLMIRPLFERHVGHLLVPSFRLAPAAAFYLFYIAVLVILVSWPEVSGTGYRDVFIKAALIGAVAYGTYEFTNLATLKPWHWSMVVADLAWGTTITAVSVTAGLAVTRSLF